MEAFKIKKVIAVVFLTALIWVWSDLALDETGDLTQIPIEMGDSSDPTLLVSFVNNAGQLTERITVNTVRLKGPVVKIGESKRLDRRELLVSLSPDQEGFIEPGESTARLASIVKQSSVIRGLGLSVESCTPSTVSVRVTRLTQKRLPVRCLNENGTMIPDDQVTITPATINMHVPEDTVAAHVTLSEADLNRARGEASIVEFPYVDIEGRSKIAKQSVSVHLSEEVTQLERKSFDGPKFCLVVDPVVQGDFQISISNLEYALRSIAFKATDEARRAFRDETYHVELVITERKPGKYSKKLEYRFPREFVQKNQIRPADESALATIDYELIPKESSSAVTTPQ